MIPLPYRHRALLGVCLLAVLAAALAPRIAQDPSYHRFADSASLLGLPSGLNVLSNLVLLWAGVAGLYRLLRQGSLRIVEEIRLAYTCFFAALVLVAFGSGWYHWSPDNVSLAFDRLPMTLAFMSFFTILLGERVSPRLARRLFPLLLLAGIASIAYWQYSEAAGRGDLRPYALVQYLPVLLTPLILLLYPSSYSRPAGIWWMLAWYLAAKLCEVFDHEIYQLLKLVSGHSLKHVAAGIATLVFLRHLRLREAIET